MRKIAGKPSEHELTKEPAHQVDYNHTAGGRVFLLFLRGAYPVPPACSFQRDCGIGLMCHLLYLLHHHPLYILFIFVSLCVVVLSCSVCAHFSIIIIIIIIFSCT
jgi:protein-S-isoprenylcysteine O-methyltransferase Ste14